MSNYLFGIKFKENNYPVIDKIFLYEGELQFNDQQITGIQGYKTLQDECVDIDCLLKPTIKISSGGCSESSFLIS